MTTRWIYKEEVEEEAVSELAQSINVNPTIARILLQRDITDFDQAREFFRHSTSFTIPF